jgi:hypothetical protein
MQTPLKTRMYAIGLLLNISKNQHATCEAGTTYSYKIQEITSVFSGGCVAQSLVL